MKRPASISFASAAIFLCVFSGNICRAETDFFIPEEQSRRLPGEKNITLETLMEMPECPEFRINEFYWNESGRGNITQISRNRNDLCMEFPLLPILPNTRLEISENFWTEKTPMEKRTRQAKGITVAGNTALNQYLSASASYTTKKNFSQDFPDTDSGYLNFRADVCSYATIHLEFERSDEVYNYFGMLQGVQADQWKVSASSDITRTLEIKGTAKYLDYSDNNQGLHFLAAAGYAFTDFPRMFKISISEEYRDTRDNYLELYFENPRFFANIIHPYWCPRNYTVETITLDWFHNLSKQQTRDSTQHFYDIKTSFGTDSENNPFLRLEVEWQYEFLKHFSSGLRGMIHRSDEWDADSAFADLRYRF